MRTKTPSKTPALCKRCGAPIYFVHNFTRDEMTGAKVASAKAWPVDAEPSEGGNCLIAWSATLSKILVTVSAKPVEGGRHAHHNTCGKNAAPAAAPDEQLRAVVEYVKEDDKWGLDGWRWEVSRPNGSVSGWADTEEEAWRDANAGGALLVELESLCGEGPKAWRIAYLKEEVRRLREVAG